MRRDSDEGHHNVATYRLDLGAVPKLAPSDEKDAHTLFLISHRGHWAVVRITLSPTPNPHVPWKYQTVRSILVPCCTNERTTYIEFIYRTIHAAFKAGEWIDGCWQVQISGGTA